MKIEKIGKIFTPSEHDLIAGPGLFAQSPQVLLRQDGGRRVFFSTRERDAQAPGKFVSRVSYADFNADLTQLEGVAHHEVLARGPLGAFDEHGVFPLNPLPVDGEVWGYTTGWTRRVSVSVDTGIGLVKSTDGGTTFQRHGIGPVLGPSLHEPFLVGDAFVVRTPEAFRMWYIFGQRWVRETETSEPDRVYKIAQATSSDGVHWQKSDGCAVIPDVLGENECQALPSVVQFEGRYHMVFCYRDVHGFRTDPTKGYRIGYAWSEDAQTWHRADEDLPLTGTPGSWDSDMQCYPHLFVMQGHMYLLYNGNAFGREGFGLAKVVP